MVARGATIHGCSLGIQAVDGRHSPTMMGGEKVSHDDERCT
jgi:hypothetical protein